ncbi:Tom37 C-terminal domain-containing protein [Hypoxylon sp. NC1633]|nr:Tom37 C-terminal domain-containing protein [Hypoxylon sp. NC1633]
MELHVWGPAFGLDSIDPECLAAITCFRSSVSPENWTLIASYAAAASPDYRLPALNCKGTWIFGYADIISYLTQHGISHIDDDLTPLQRADSLACSSYLTTRGSGLLAMSLYASPRAWAKVTRPAYSLLLPFPLTWTVPPAVRALAIEKAENMGMGTLAAEVDAEESSSSSAPAETTSTGFLRLRESFRPSMIMQPEHSAAIRFQHFAEDLYAVLDQLRGDKQFFLRDDSPSSLDFLAYGYLQLMRVQTPHATLQNALKSYPRLIEFLWVLRSHLHSCGRDDDLSWRQPAPGRLALIGRFAEGSLEAVPILGDSWQRWRKGGVKSCTDVDDDDDGVKSPGQLIAALGGAAAGVATVGAVALLRALSPFGAETHRFGMAQENKAGLRRFGEMGSLLEDLLE